MFCNATDAHLEDIDSPEYPTEAVLDCHDADPDPTRTNPVANIKELPPEMDEWTRIFLVSEKENAKFFVAFNVVITKFFV